MDRVDDSIDVHFLVTNHPSINTMLNFLKTSVDVQGLRTELIVQAFADRILVLVTQVGKVGNLVHSSHLSLWPPANARSRYKPPSPRRHLSV
jgi:hypothetical protein